MGIFFDRRKNLIVLLQLKWVSVFEIFDVDNVLNECVRGRPEMMSHFQGRKLVLEYVPISQTTSFMDSLLNDPMYIKKKKPPQKKPKINSTIVSTSI